CKVGVHVDSISIASLVGKAYRVAGVDSWFGNRRIDKMLLLPYTIVMHLCKYVIDASGSLHGRRLNSGLTYPVSNLALMGPLASQERGNHPIYGLGVPLINRLNSRSVFTFQSEGVKGWESREASIFACAPSTTRGEPTHLDVSPNGDTFMYANGRSVIIRNLATPTLVDEYCQHVAPVNVARFSPSGCYAASGDAGGVVRVWDVTQAAKGLKLEVGALAGKVKDVGWDFESNRVLAVGEGRERFGHVFMLDSGASAGEVMGHSQPIAACSFRPARPSRAVTAGHDFKVNLYVGAPYKFSRTLADHTNAVHGVRYAPSGDLFASVGADQKVFMYDGLTGDVKGRFEGHTGSVFALAWSPTSAQFITSSGDGSVKLWDVATQRCISTLTVGEAGVESQQVGNLWANDMLLSLSLSGTLNYFDPRAAGFTRQVVGHQRGITALEVMRNSEEPTLLTGSYDGRVLAWNYSDGSGKEVAGPKHSNKVNGIASAGSGFVSVAMDDTFRRATRGLEYADSALGLDSEPTAVVSIASEAGPRFAVTTKSAQLHIISGGVVGVGLQGLPVQIYQLRGDRLELMGPAGPDVGVGAVASAYSADGALFACAAPSGKISLYSAGLSPFELKTNRWAFHTAKVTSLHAIYVWSVEAPGKRVAILNAHPGPIYGVSFLELKGGTDLTLISVGSDACVKTWSVTFP
ncbi:WD40 repeat-like protein, partial [Massospora cicadina]